MTASMTVGFEVDRSLETLVEVLRYRAQHHPDRLAYSFLPDGDDQGLSLTYGELDLYAKAIAARLRERSRPGDRALMLYPSGLEFVAGFFGCLYGGLVAVPAYPPRKNQNLGRLQAIIEDCDPVVVMTTAKVMRVAEPLFNETPDLANLSWLASDTVPMAESANWSAPLINDNSLAFLQYTSGSTGSPKGVMVSHGNLLYNEEMIRSAFGFNAETHFASWLPLFHDMGLIGTTLQPFYNGSSCIMMSPAAFLQKPLRWLQAITDFRAVVTVAPNFAYELCVKQISEEQRQGIDLSSLRFALSGAEAVRSETVDMFVNAYSKYGFKREAFYPTYGLAEATLFVSGASKFRPKYAQVDSRELERHKAILSTSKDPVETSILVGNGSTWLEQEIAIVDPESFQQLSDGSVGEIWVKGKNVCKGYWNKPELTEEVFAARISDSNNGPFLRTGDLGVLLEGELYITGRQKDLVIIRGRNHYPTDIEHTVQKAHAALKEDAGGAFSVEIEGEERLVLVQEVERSARAKLNVEEVASAVRKAVALQHELQVYALVLIKPGQIPKTSSGKIQRRACKAAFLSDTIDAIATDIAGKTVSKKGEFSSVLVPQLTRDELLAMDSDILRVTAITQYLMALAADVARLPLAAIKADQALLSLGLDSLQITQLQTRIGEQVGLSIALPELFEADNIDALSNTLLQALHSPSAAIPQLLPVSHDVVLPLSYAQQRQWFLNQVDLNSAQYNLPAALKLRGRLDIAAIQRTLDEVVRRHEVLRTVYEAVDGVAFQRILPNVSVPVVLEDVSSMLPELRDEKTQLLISEESRRIFDLTHAPLLRAMIIKTAVEEHILLINVHHIAADGWSFGILIRELSAIYAAFAFGRPAPLPALTIQYADYAHWQRNLPTDVYAEQLNWWKQQLANVPVLDLPLDKARPPKQTFRGDNLEFEISSADVRGLKDISRVNQVTLFVTLMSVFKTLLFRYTHSEDVCVGTAIANRRHSELEKLIGFFVNSLALRSDISGNPSFVELLKRVHAVSQHAFAHQDAPFEQVVDALGVARDQSYSPVFQVMFVLQNSPLSREFTMPGLSVEMASASTLTSKFDLTLFCWEENGAIKATLEYASDLFNRSTVMQMVEHFRNLIRSVIVDSSVAISDLQMLTASELKQFSDWNTNALPFSQTATMHSLFEQQVQKTPHATALVFENERLSYAELNARANQLAHYLIELGVHNESFVGVCYPRTSEMVVGMLAILKAGGAYVPLDPAYPSDRVAYMLSDSQAPVVLTHSSIRNNMECLANATERHVISLDVDQAKLLNFSCENPNRAVKQRQVSYAIYTSGSTGLPKGVAIEHRSVVAFIAWAASVFAPEDWMGVAAATSICFDLSVYEIFATLALGGKIILTENALAIPDAPAKDEITLINTVPSAIAALEREKKIPQSVRIINLAGEALAQSLVEKLYAVSTLEKVYDLYGPSEDTTYSTFVLRKQGAKPSIGKPINNTYAYVLNPYGAMCPRGVPGELLLGGDGLARGYLHRPEMTAEKFIRDPFSNDEAARLYRTGDLVRFYPDGNLEYLGRIDHQVKVRGFRIELGEIEACIKTAPGICEALVMTRDDAFGNKQVVAYLVATSARVKAVNAVRTVLQERLPEYMMPAAFVLMDAFPLTPNGKVDRKALPAPEETDFVVSSEFMEARNATEKAVASIWKTVLKRNLIGVNDSFFELGGHSLLATQVLSRIRDQFGVELTVRDFFANPSVAGLSEKIGATENKTAQLPPIEKVDRTQELPLSYAQQRMWFLSQFETGDATYSVSISYNMPAVLRIRGQFNVEAMREAFQELVRRHEILRTTFVIDDGSATQFIRDQAKWFLDVRDLSSLPADELEPEVKKLAIDEVGRAFDLVLAHELKTRRTRLLRTRVLKLADDHHILLLTMHHIVSDGWSMWVLVKEIAALYAAFVKGEPSPLAELPIQYADYAAWQRQLMQGELLERQLNYWKEKLRDVPVLELPTDRPRPPIQTFSGDIIEVRIPADLTRSLNEISRNSGATLFMTLMASFSFLLGRYSGQEDVCIGTPIANRTRPELENMIGCFVNSIAVRTDLSNNPTFTELLAQVKETTLHAYANQEVPFEKLVDTLNISRDMSHTPIFQVMFGLQNTPVDRTVELAGCQIEVMPSATRTSKFDLVFNLTETSDGLSGELEFNTDLFNRSTVERLLNHFDNVLRAVAYNPVARLGDIQILGQEELSQQLVEWNRGADETFARHATLHSLFEEQAERFPAKVALCIDGLTLTYSELNAHANQLAHFLIEQGIQRNQLVGLSLERSFEMIVGILGILKAGAAYVPIDPHNPRERTEFILQDAGVTIIVTQRSIKNNFPKDQYTLIALDEANGLAKHPVHNPGVGSYEDRAYVIYTSGTTGKPKGVLIPHTNVVRLFTATEQWFGFNEKDVWTLFHSFAFDFSVWEIWGALLTGGRLVIVPYLISRSPDEFYQLLIKEQVTVLNQTPSAFTQLINVEEQKAADVHNQLALRYVIFGGEALDFAALQTWQKHHSLEQPRLVNMYGITETTVHVTYYPVSEEDLKGRASIIGRPIPDLPVYVLDPNLNPLPVGVPGELHVGGAGLAYGYLNRPELTDERFIENPFRATQPGLQAGTHLYDRLYKTGDVVRYLANGDLEYLGRIDDQVKVRGFRIELGEIESAICQFEGVREACVLAREDEPGNKRLVAYIATGEAQEADDTQAKFVQELRQHLKTQLPEYMVPAAFVLLETLPLTGNGKIDKRALPVPDHSALITHEYIAPRNETEQTLVQIWQDVLKLERVGVQDNFFEIGGQSLLATQIITRVRDVFEVDIALARIFEDPTIESLAMHIVEATLQNSLGDDEDLAALLASIESE